MKIDGKAALVTGSSRGIGAATAEVLAGRGAMVGINYHEDRGGAEEVAERIRAAGGRAAVLQADVADEGQVRVMVEAFVRETGRLDILVNNAGARGDGTVESVSTEAWRRAFAVHVDGALFCARAAIPHLRVQGAGSIVNLSSVAGIRGCPGNVAYQTVKGAVLALTRGMARDLADDHIRVNCVSPGIIRTDFHAGMTEQQKKYNCRHRIPLHREGRPEEIAAAIVMFVENDYITGENLVIDGGLTMRIA